MINKLFKLCIVILIGLTVPFNAQSLSSSRTPNGFIIRTGVNVSHWLSQSERRGEARAKYITRADLDTIAAVGFDHVRIPVDEVQLWDSLGNKEKDGFDLLHDAIKWAFAANLRVIVDLHIIRSFYFNATSNPLWTSEADQEKLVNMWMQLSDELHAYPDSMLAYEILNEAVAQNPDDWNKLLNKVIKAIRVKEPDRTIVVGSNMWQSAGTFPELKFPKDDKNLILSFHFYTPMALTHHTASWTPIAGYKGPVNYPGQIVDTAYYAGMSEKAVEFMRHGANGYFTKDSLEKIMMPAIKIAEENNLPLYCGEYGIYPHIPEVISLRWYKDICSIFNEHHIAYCHWCYKGDFPVVDENLMPNYKLISVLTAK